MLGGRRIIKQKMSFLTVTLVARAGEYVVLSSGFRLHAESHVIDGSTIKLNTSEGVIEMPAAMVAAFEPEEYAPPAPAPPEPPHSPAETPPDLTPRELTTRAAIHAGLPPAIVHSVAKAESGYRADAVSPKGAVGLMQLMPATAAELKVNPHDPAQNAEAGA